MGIEMNGHRAEGQSNELPAADHAGADTGASEGTRQKARRRQEPRNENGLESIEPEELAGLAASASWDLHWFVTALSRRRWWAAGVVVCAIAAAVIYVMTATPLYVARA
jgi:uncharacterized protein involved in exopolysaccharide biosynthesis